VLPLEPSTRLTQQQVLRIDIRWVVADTNGFNSCVNLPRNLRNDV